MIHLSRLAGVQFFTQSYLFGLFVYPEGILPKCKPLECYIYKLAGILTDFPKNREEEVSVCYNGLKTRKG